MTQLFEKLGIGDVDEILILNEPEGFCNELNKLKNIIVRESVIRTSEIDFALIFVTEASQIENRIETVYPKLLGDAIIWFAFPSDVNKTKISETEGWGVLGDYNLIKIGSTNITKDWIGVRFRKVEFLNNTAKYNTNTLTK